MTAHLLMLPRACCWTLALLCAGASPGLAQAAHPTQAPVFTSRELSSVPLGTLYHYRFTAVDPSGRPLAYAAEALPSWLRFDSESGALSGRAPRAGRYPVRLLATTESDTARQSFVLTVHDSETVNILPLGNSITNGTSTFSSYRRPLWHMLHEENFNFDFIGSWSKHAMGGEVPTPDFDLDHEGHSGWRFGDLLDPPAWDDGKGDLTIWLDSYTPDIVLLKMGTNDVFQCVPGEEMLRHLGSIVSLLRARNADVRIFVGRILPMGSRWAEQALCDGVEYRTLKSRRNAEIAHFVRTASTSRSPITLVHFPGFDPALHTYDALHPNEEGEELMAASWYEAIAPYLPRLRR